MTTTKEEELHCRRPMLPLSSVFLLLFLHSRRHHDVQRVRERVGAQQGGRPSIPCEARAAALAPERRDGMRECKEKGRILISKKVSERQNTKNGIVSRSFFLLVFFSLGLFLLALPLCRDGRRQGAAAACEHEQRRRPGQPGRGDEVRKRKREKNEADEESNRWAFFAQNLNLDLNLNLIYKKTASSPAAGACPAPSAPCAPPSSTP